jgi:cysteine synthase
MWPRTSELEKIAKDNGRTWTGPSSQNLMKHEIIPFISRLPDRYRPFLEKYPSLALIGGTPLLRVRVPELPENGAEIFAKAEWTNPGGSVKDRPVLRMLLEAVLSGELTRERTILDSSSGNAGIAYAMIGSMMGYQAELVVPGNASEERKKRIRAHGATLVETDPLEGYDAAECMIPPAAASA